MSQTDAIKIEGKVMDVLSNSLVRVEFGNGHRTLARVSGRMRINFIRLAAGDKVMVEMSPCDLSKGVIVDQMNEMKS